MTFKQDYARAARGETWPAGQGAVVVCRPAVVKPRYWYSPTQGKVHITTGRGLLRLVRSSGGSWLGARVWVELRCGQLLVRARSTPDPAATGREPCPRCWPGPGDPGYAP